MKKISAILAVTVVLFSVCSSNAQVYFGDGISSKVLLARKQKWVTTTRKYKCNFNDYYKLKCDIPNMIFYSEGGYNGYLTHTYDMPVEIREHDVLVTYGGTVYQGYPIPIPTTVKEFTE